MFPSFPCYKEGTGGRGQIAPGPPVLLTDAFRPQSKQSVINFMVELLYNGGSINNGTLINIVLILNIVSCLKMQI
jgi:hypothetical protein